MSCCIGAIYMYVCIGAIYVCIGVLCIVLYFCSDLYAPILCIVSNYISMYAAVRVVCSVTMGVYIIIILLHIHYCIIYIIIFLYIMQLPCSYHGCMSYIHYCILYSQYNYCTVRININFVINNCFGLQFNLYS